ncbi:MAG: FAD-binding protein, partial [Pyramidobacter sp.]|nr:FAD-binding protein [Pyramidobacter sp.]
MYPESFQESIRKVEANRAANAAMTPRRMTAEEKDTLLKEFHPDYRENEFELLKVGPNAGDKVPHELAAMLQAHPRVAAGEIDLAKPAYDVDVLVIGGGGAGSSAAIEANEAGASVLMCTKLRIGDANTMMAEGGIQAADKDNDSPARHFLDAYGGGHFEAKKELLAKLVYEAPECIKWLNEL